MIGGAGAGKEVPGLGNNDILELIRAEKVDFRRSKRISIQIRSESGTGSPSESQGSLRQRKAAELGEKALKRLQRRKMRPINAHLLKTVFTRVGIRGNFINFVSRNFSVRVKAESFKFLRLYFRDFEEKLLDERCFEVPVLREFDRRFEVASFKNLHRRPDLLRCDHSDQCAHTAFDLLSFLAEPEPGAQLGTL